MMLLIMGAPGAGKGTQSENLAKEFGFIKLSTGDIFRSHISAKTELGKKVESVLAQGQLVSDSILLDLIKSELDKMDPSKNLILDGYPRTIEQAHDLDRLGHRQVLEKVIHIDVSDEEIKQRIFGRLTCPRCQSVYHEKNRLPKNPGLCDTCGSPLGARSDDAEGKLAVRLDLYRKQTEPVLEFYKKKGIYCRVDGAREVSQVYGDVKTLVLTGFR
ncbi:MAG: adenylate kinase [Oligoflexales bacterium]|nr:adenylate kinase [Oligoflexales bacterium]